MKKVIILLFVFVTYVTAYAQDAFQSELFAAETVLKHRTELELSETQISKIKKIYNDNISLFNSTKWDLDAKQVDLNKLISESKVNEAAALIAMDKITALEQQLKSQRLKMLIKIKNELSADQQSKLKKLRKDNDISVFKLTTPISEEPRIVLRGGASKDGESPMYVVIDKNEQRKFVNGEAKEGLLGISPDKIESVNVLKGKAAVNAYGKEGKNGVVVIKLKQ